MKFLVLLFDAYNQYSRKYIVKSGFYTKAFVLILTLSLYNSTVISSVAQQVNLKLRNSTLTHALNELEKQTNYIVWFEGEHLQSSVKINANFKNVEISEALKKVFDGQPFTYQIVGETIVVKKKNGNSPSLNSLPEDQQSLINVEGRLIDPSGQAVPHANIYLLKDKKRIGQAVRTKEDGSFSLDQVPENAEVEIVILGFETLMLKVKPQMGVISLVFAEEDIEEVVVTGIFERSAQTFTGSVNTITQEDIRKTGNQNVLNALSILDPSVQAMQNLSAGSDPNAIGDYRLRGASSLPVDQIVSEGAASNIRNQQDFYQAYSKKVDDIKNIYTVNPNLPLFVLDGFEVPIARINDLDIHEVRSITILKDASATSIYGSRGANGVVVIERIKPERGSMLFSYKTDLSFSLPDLRDYDMLNASEKLEVEKIAGVYSSGDLDRELELQKVYNERLKEVLRGRDFYWLSMPLRNSFSHKHRLSMEGGQGDVSYGVNFNYNQNDGVMKGSSRQTYNGGVTLSYRGEKLQIQNQLNLQFANGYNSKWGTFNQYVRTNPYLYPYDENGNISPVLQSPISDLQTSVYGYIYNPAFNSTLNGKDFTKSSNLINNTAVTYYFMPNLSLRGRLSVTSQSDDSEVFLPAEHTTFQQMGVDIFKRGAYTSGFGKLFSYDGNLDLNYNFNARDHHFYTTLSTHISERSNENVVVQVEGLPSALTDYIFYGRNYVNDRPDGSESTIRTVGFLGNVNYAYDNRYLADFSYRLDGASSVGSNRLFAPFWSVGLGWNIHQERFLRTFFNNNDISQLKLRSSIGMTGAQQFDPYMAYRTYNYSLEEAYITNIGATLISIGNEDLTWQTTNKFNLGMDVSILDNRMHFNADFYRDYTDKFIADFSLPLSTGFSTYKGNLGAIKSNGFEARVSYQMIKPKEDRDFGFTLMANIGHNKTIIDKISNELKDQNEKLQSISNTTQPFSRYEEGESIDAIWVVPSLGIDPATGQEMYLKKNGTSTFYWDASDMIAAGVSTPKYHGTLGFNLTYAGFQLNTYLTYRNGGQLYNNTLLSKVENVNLVDNADRRVLTERWKEPGDVAQFKAMSISGANTNSSTRFVQNENTLQMTSASLLYRFKDDKLKRYGLRNLNIGFYMNDIFRISSIKIERGLDYPFAKNFSLSLQTSF